jgi:hypothetical protein
MRRSSWVLALAIALTAGGPGLRAEPPCGEACRDGSLQHLGPAGGWHPYGGGLLHWWDPHCFPRCGTPDNYCRKPFPRVCWPSYPPFYLWGTPCSGPAPNVAGHTP